SHRNRTEKEPMARKTESMRARRADAGKLLTQSPLHSPHLALVPVRDRSARVADGPSVTGAIPTRAESLPQRVAGRRECQPARRYWSLMLTPRTERAALSYSANFGINRQIPGSSPAALPQPE